MNIEKAIETLTRYEKDYLVRTEEDFDGSVRLGVEAMKRIKENRGGTLLNPFRVLPGEKTE